MNKDYSGEWITAPVESIKDSGKTIFVTGRADVNKFRTNPKFNDRITVTFNYTTDTGLPDENTSRILEEITDRLITIFHKDPAAVLTGIYTGDNERNWVFYSKSTNIFQILFNKALADLPLFPITISADKDPGWEEYREMMEILT